MQSVVIMAFRKRLKKRGYTSISICKIIDSENYLIKAFEPLAQFDVSCVYSITEMYHAFRF